MNVHLRSPRARRRFLTGLAGLAAALFAACGARESAPKFNATDISGVDWARGFDLTDHTGRRRTLADFRGKAVMLFFGYTGCPDAYPTTLAEMAEVVKRLGPDGARVQGVFITVDPERDTANVLAQYVPAFHPSFIGLRGTPDEIARTAKEFKVFYKANRSEAGGTGQYLVDHTAAIFVFDPQGRPRLYVSQNRRTTDSMVADLKRLLGT